MKQGGAFLAVILAISGILHLTGSGGAEQSSSADTGAAKKKISHSHPEYVDELQDTIKDFYGVSRESKDDKDDKDDIDKPYWNVPDAKELTGNANTTAANPRENIRFVIAILPDPLHTRLALVFDRSIEAIQEAAERDRYTFDRAIFPWDRTPSPQPDDIDKRREAAEVQKATEAYPGLLVFRGPNSDRNGATVDYPAPLFVFVVGETPTSGIRKKQFQHAIKIMKEIREGKKPTAAVDAATPPAKLIAPPAKVAEATSPAKPRSLLILGPSSSGSLRSLKRELRGLENDPENRELQTFVYSGSVTDAGSMFEFLHPVDPTVHFASFQDNDDFVRDRFLRFACRNGYYPDEIATLSEGDTAYGFGIQDTGKVAVNASQLNQDNAKKASIKMPAAPLQADESSDERKHCSPENLQQMVHLRFPREISYFRAAYQAKPSSPEKSDSEIPVPQSSAVALNPEEIGTDDDAALPYAGAQTPATQEAVMLGIISELNKHHTKFTILYASDPLDQFFLARYLRTKYPRGRVVVTTPDLLLISQEDSSLRGVIGINTYPVVPGLNDTFCFFSEKDATKSHRHDDRLFVSSSSIGTFNAMQGLLAQADIVEATQRTASSAKPPGANPDSKTETVANSDEAPPATVPMALYAEYATPPVRILASGSDAASCVARPLVWLTMLGSDGFWPVAGLSDKDLQTADRNLPIVMLHSEHGGSTEPDILSQSSSKSGLTSPLDDASNNSSNDKTKNPPKAPNKDERDELHLRLPAAWKISYCLVVFLLALHVFLSLNGSILAGSEPRAQFARIDDWRDVTVIGLGALALATAFVTTLFSGGPIVGELGLISWFSLWLPLPVFVAVTTYDLSWLRNQWRVAAVFAAATFFMLVLQAIVWLGPRDFALFWIACGRSDPSAACNLIAQNDMLHPALWSTRLLHYTSGLSPVLPILFLAAAGYWWMWQSLRGVTLVDRRRPRLPDRTEPVILWYRINDHEAAELRTVAHPFFFKWSVVLVLIVVGVFLMTVLDYRHPVQTIEGEAYDWIYTIVLGLMVATFIGILLKLIFAWLKCGQILSGLDRLPLRDAFSRMKHLSWHSFWNPGGSTMRATYKVLGRGLDCLGRLSCLLDTVDDKAPIANEARDAVQESISATSAARNDVRKRYEDVVDAGANAKAMDAAGDTILTWLAMFFRYQVMIGPLPLRNRLLAGIKRDFCSEVAEYFENRVRESVNLAMLMWAVERLQVTMADAAADIVEKVLQPWWQCEKAPAVSEDSRLKTEELPLTRALAEEYVALVYVNFLITVLLRMRTMVIAAIGMYVFIVLSMNVYPFEPHPALQTLAIVLLAAMGAAVGFVYAQMHRDPILSRLTSTTSGELGWDFWLKLASAGAIPVFSLLAVQFPEINRFLFSWLEPALQAVK